MGGPPGPDGVGRGRGRRGSGRAETRMAATLAGGRTMAGHLNGRLARLEAVMRPETGHCRSCGLLHVQPLTIDLARRIIGPVSLMAMGLHQYVAENPAPKLCLCDPCCG